MLPYERREYMFIRNRDNPTARIIGSYIAKALYCPDVPNRGNHKNPVAFAYRKDVVRQSSGYRTVSNGDWQDGNFLELPSFDQSWETSYSGAYNACLSSLNDSIRGGVDLSIDAFQGAQTKQMFVAIAKFTTYVKQFRKEMKRVPIRALGSKWLEYQYGWKPLLTEIYEIAHRQIKPNPDNNLITLHGRASQRNVARYMIDPGSGASQVTMEETLRMEIGLTLSPDTNRLQGLATFTSLNPVSIAWELMPYSFVVDWFIDVGGYLRNTETALLHQNRFVSGYRTYTRKKAYYQTPVSVQDIGGLRYVTTNIVDGLWSMTWFDRTVLGSYPFALFPTAESHLGWQRLLSAASLLSQFLGRR